MNIKKLASYLCKHEALKSEVKIGDMREVLGILSDLMYADYSVKKARGCTWETLCRNGYLRFEKSTAVTIKKPKVRKPKR